MAPLLTSADYIAIRAAIDITLDSTMLPDATIALDLFIGAGMRDVLAVDTTAESRTGDELQHAKTAAILFTAARLIGALPQITSEESPEHSYKRQNVDTAARASELRGMASAELDAYLDPGDAASDRPTMFATGRGYRGRWG